jgi:DNA-binding FrmR family transcriptional regulator
MMMYMQEKQLHNRLSRLEGQLRKLHADIEAGKDCSDVVTQFQAVKGALAGAFEEYVKSSLEQCAKKDEKKMEQLIKLLVRA